MKTRNRTAIICSMALMVVQLAQALTIVKTNNTTDLSLTGSWVGGVVPGAGDTAQWNNIVTAANGPNLGGNLTWGQILITNPGGGITIGNTASSTLTLNGLGSPVTGIDMSSASQNLTINDPVALGASQTWSVGPGRSLSVGTYAITASSGVTLTKTGTGVLSIPNATLGAGFAGNMIIAGGRVLAQPGGLPNGNLSLNGGHYEDYVNGTAFSRNLGTGTGQVQIPGGVSGFSESGYNSEFWSVSLGTSIQWNNVAGTFNPTEFLLMGSASQAQNGTGTIRVGGLSFISNIDLNGGNRTVRVDQNDGGASAPNVDQALPGTGAQITGNLTDSVGSGGALTKTGVGRLLLNPAATNTYTGGTTISAGTVRFMKLAAMSASGTVAVQNGATIGISVGAGSDWTTSTGTGNGTIGGLLAGNGGQAGGSVSYTGNVGLDLNVASSQSYSGDIGNVGTSLTLYKTGLGTLTLSGNNSYTGATVIVGYKYSTAGGTLAVASLANAGQNSPIGAYPNPGAGGLSLRNGTFQYTGSTTTTDRGFSLDWAGQDSTINVSGTAGTVLTMGDFAINASQSGTTKLNITGTTGNSLVLGNCTLNNNKSLVLNNAIPVTINGTVGAGTGVLTLSGMGGLTINGACNFTGATTINGGKLSVLTGSGTRYTSAITINVPGASVTASPSFGVKLAAANGQWASTAALTVGGAGTQLDIDYGSTTPSTSTSQDPIKCTTLTVSGAGIIKILGNAASFTAGQTYPLINGTTSVPAAADPYTGLVLVLPTGVYGHLKTIANHLELVVDAVSSGSSSLSWNSGNANWDTGTPWINNGGAATSFSAGNGVFLGDAASVSGNPTLTISGASVAPAAIVMNSANHDYTITGNPIIAGALTVNAPARTLTLQGANSFTGVTTLKGGTLKIQPPSSSALIQTLGPIYSAAADNTVQSDKAAASSVTTTFTTLGRAPGSTVTFSCPNGTVGTDNSIKLTQAAGFIDRGDFYNGDSFAWMNAANTYVRGINYGVDSGCLQDPASTWTAGNHILLTSASSTYSVTPANSGSVKINTSGTWTMPANSGLRADGIIKTGGGTYTLDYGTGGGSWLQPQSNFGELVINTYGATDILSVLAGAYGNGGSLGQVGILTKSGAGTLMTGGTTQKKSAQITGAIYLNGGTYQADLGFSDASPPTANAGTALSSTVNIYTQPSSTLYINFPSGSSGYASMTVSGLMSGGGALKKGNTGTLILAGANTFSGMTTVAGGLLALNNPLALQGSILDTAGSIASSSATTGLKAGVTMLTLGGLSGNKDLSTLFNAANGYTTLATLTLNPGAGMNPSYSGNIADGAAGMTLTKTGAGTQTLSGANTYSGATTVTAGTLKLGANDVLPNASAVSIGAATLDADTRSDTAGTLDVTAAATINVGSSAALAFANSSAIDWTGGTLNITGDFVSGSSLRFGVNESGLTAVQLAKITITGISKLGLNSSGYLVAVRGTMIRIF